MNAEKVEKTVERMNAELRRKYRTLVAEIANADRRDALARYKIGKLLKPVIDDEQRQRGRSKFGPLAVATLADALGWHRSTLYDYANVAATWNSAQIKALLARKSSRGRPLSWSHLVELAEVANGKERGNLTDTALSEGLTVARLRKTKAGEPIEDDDDSRAVASRFREMKATAETLLARAHGWQDLLRASPTSRIPSDVREVLRETVAVHSELLKVLERILGPRARARSGRGPKTGRGSRRGRRAKAVKV